jgi:hypothetical protein
MDLTANRELWSVFYGKLLHVCLGGTINCNEKALVVGAHTFPSNNSSDPVRHASSVCKAISSIVSQRAYMLALGALNSVMSGNGAKIRPSFALRCAKVYIFI